jgi:asparagine synthase (glutamine-hydrolysing)
MCGIVGIFAYKPSALPVDEGDLVQIRDAMLRRGPDAAGSWISGDKRVALGHRRLSIIDLSPNGNQPMLREETGTRITFNGEIYNYRELRRMLEQCGHVFRTNSDTEVLLHAYDEYGEKIVDHLRGMYAFVIWDPRRGGMFLARDPFGIKPLYYTDDGGTITVASQVKALLTTERVSRVLDPAAQVSFLVWGFIVEPHTLYLDIRALPAGSTLWIDAHGARKPAQYWSATEVLRSAEADAGACNLVSPETRREILREALVDSIRHHMVSDVPVGVFLSGGLDSASLIALASEMGLGELRALTLGFDELRGMPADETVCADEIASIYLTRHETHWIGAQKFFEERRQILTAMDQPSIDGANVYFVSKMAATAGMKVALSGLGGDELFGSYPSFQQIPHITRLMRPFSAVSSFGVGFRTVAAPVLSQFTSPKYASLFEFGTSTEDAYLLRRGLFLPWELPQVLDPDVAWQGWQELEVKARLREVTDGIKSPYAQVAALEMSTYMRNQLLRDSDWAGMAHSIEIRVPFVDAALLRQLAPFIVSQSPVGKTDMTNTLRTPLPDNILQRPKTGFSVPIRDWLMQDQNVGSQNERGLRGWAKYILAANTA